MEGIVDGRAVDDCFWCGLLHPGRDECPRCDRRMRYVAAAMMDDVALAESLAQKVAAYHAADDDDRSGRAERLTALLEQLHGHAPASLTILDELGGPSIATLRREWNALTGATAERDNQRSP